MTRFVILVPGDKFFVWFIVNTFLSCILIHSFLDVYNYYSTTHFSLL